MPELAEVLLLCLLEEPFNMPFALIANGELLTNKTCRTMFWNAQDVLLGDVLSFFKFRFIHGTHYNAWWCMVIHGPRICQQMNVTMCVQPSFILVLIDCVPQIQRPLDSLSCHRASFVSPDKTICFWLCVVAGLTLFKIYFRDSGGCLAGESGWAGWAAVVVA